MHQIFRSDARKFVSQTIFSTTVSLASFYRHFRVESFASTCGEKSYSDDSSSDARVPFSDRYGGSSDVDAASYSAGAASSGADGTKSYSDDTSSDICAAFSDA